MTKQTAELRGEWTMSEPEPPSVDASLEDQKLVLLRPISKRSRRTIFLIYASWMILLGALDVLLRIPKDPIQLTPGRPGAIAGIVLSIAGLIVGAVLLARERDDRAVFLASGYLAAYSVIAHVLFSGFLPQVMALALLPGIIMVVSFIRIIRTADELEKKTLSETLSFAFILSSAVLVLYGFAEVFGAPRPPVIVWTLVLFVSCDVGLRIATKRYRG
ncbi:MAG: hypothetical protein ABI592_16255 [Acidobacteriota bacterium]